MENMNHSKTRTSEKASRFTESVIREMTRLAARHEAINLSQGFPDFPAPAVLKQAACVAIGADINQYAITWGAKRFRDALAAKTKRHLGLKIDPERHITVCCGSTEAMISSLMAVVDPGDEVVIFEPYYENYWPDAVLCGATPRFVRLHAPDWTFKPGELAAAFSERTKAVILCTPNNPTGKVFSRTELEAIGELCKRHDALAITDEIYEHIIYEGAEHTSMATLPGMWERTITINSMSKTYSVTGWRVGYAIAPEDLTASIRKVHDFLTVGAAAPLQEAGVTAMELPESYYSKMAAEYAERREFLLNVLREVGFEFTVPQGAYYVMTDFRAFGYDDDLKFTRHMIEDIGVAVVPGSSFFSDPESGKHLVRFCFCKTRETLEAAAVRLRKLKVTARR